jgi:hypothetical protein
MRLHYDEDDGGDGFLIVLMDTTLYHNERGGRRREAKRALSRSTELKNTKDRSTLKEL